MSNFLSDSVKSGFFMYMAETEGMDNLVNTRQAKINAIIKDLQELGPVILNGPDYYLRRACAAHDFDPTPAEIKQIEEGVNK